ncbi:copper resistance CopC/CopD family protein [Allorhizocola rhizosphaerae]|uniref:copper resistance CopC/CopD family protein n=1 Tax=Allorhizocola rhizosphaerae TaxID=1872709 RepID=UPI000E3E730D|nr:copper resistance protein CopC [Allorhizocola rhizosphaerae]
MRRFLPLLIGAMVLLPAAPAQAHAALVKTNPVQGTTIQVAPKQVELTFSEAITPVNDKIRIIGPDGKRADSGTPQVEGAILRIGLKDNPPRGTYLVSFRVISADSHPVPGGFTFSIGEPSATPTQEASEEDDTTITWLIGIAKYVGYAGLVLLVGAVLVLTLLWPARLDRAGPKRLLWLGFGLVTLSTVGSLALQGPYTGLGFEEVMASPFGIALLVRLGVLAVAAILLRPLINGTGGIVDRVLVLGLAVIGAVTWPLAGHPAGSPVPPVSIVVDALHLAGVAAWLGGLAMLALFLLRKATETELHAILPVWSRWAGLAVSTVLLAGVISALIEVGTVTALYKTTYGRYLLVKLALVALVMGAAMLARRAVSQHRTTIGPLVKTELAIAAVVLGLTAALTQTTPARTAEAIAQAPAIGQGQIFATTLESNLFRLQIEVDPAKRGNNLIHLYAYTPEGQPLKVVEWKATVALPSAGVEPVDVPMLRLTDSHATGSTSIPTAGDWVFKFTLRTTEIDQDSVTTTIKIK